MRRLRLIFLTVVTVAVIIGFTAYFNRVQIRDWLRPKPIVPIAQPLKEIVPVPTQPTVTTTPTAVPKPTVPVPTSAPIKDEINLAVPFASQAPFGSWVMPYKEACEEASLIMVDYYLRGVSLSKQQMKDTIDEQVAWQEATWGGHYDIGVEKTLQLAQHFYPDYSIEIIYSLTPDKIRQQLTLGRPVVVPAAGRELFNPNFTAPGPLYHMLVIKGYTKDGKFITNDPGTRNGADYVYTESVLMNAIRDWTGSAPDGGKVGLVMY